MFKFRLRTAGIYSQIDQYVEWRRQRVTCFSDSERSCIERFVSLNGISDVGEVSVEHVRNFYTMLDSQFASRYLRDSSLRCIRNFVRYFHARGYPCVSASAILKLSTVF